MLSNSAAELSLSSAIAFLRSSDIVGMRSVELLKQLHNSSIVTVKSIVIHTVKTLCHRKVTTLWKWPKSKSARFTYGWNPPPQVTNGPYRVWSWVGPLGPGGPILILGGPKAHFLHFLNRLLHTQYMR